MMNVEEGHIIRNNPLRILGVFSDTPKKEIVANLGKLRAFAKTGKTLNFDTDFTTLLGPVVRTIETIEKANNSIALPKDKLQAGMFWFMQHTDNDKAAMACLKSGNPDEAMIIIQKKGNYSGVINMAVLSLILNRWDIALYSYAYLLESPLKRAALVKAFTDTEDFFSEEDLVEYISNKLVQDFPHAHWIDQLQHENVELEEKTYPFKSRFAESKFLAQLSEKCVDRIKKDIDSVLGKASSVARKDAKANLGMAEQVEERCKPMLKEMRQALGKEDKGYIEYADDVAIQILENCIAYYNNDADNPKRARNVIKYVRYAYRTAEGKIAKERAKKNLDILNETLKNLMPESIEEEFNAIDNLVMNYHDKSGKGDSTILLGPIIDEAYIKILSIKEKVGKDNKHYLSISSNFVNFAMQEIVKKINSTHYNNSAPSNYTSVVLWGRQLFDALVKFDKDEECRADFDKNFSTLMEIVRKTLIKPVPRQSSSNNSSQHNHSSSWTTNSYAHTQSCSTSEPSKIENKVSVLPYIIAIAGFVFIFVIWLAGSSGYKSKVKEKDVNTTNTSTTNTIYQESTPTTSSSESEYNSIISSGDDEAINNDFSHNNYESENVSQTESFTTIQYNTGDRPYKSTYGKGNFDSHTQNSLLIKNGSSTDAVVFLERTNGKKIRHVYIERGRNYTMKNIPGGQYIIKVMQGTDWNPEKDNGDGNPKGGFMYSCSISKSESYDPFDYPDPSSGQYGTYEVTLYKVQNGNMQTEAINENDLF